MADKNANEVCLLLNPTSREVEELVELWEASVTATHHFLTPQDIHFYKPLLKERYLPGVHLYVIRDGQQAIVAFMGLSDVAIEMLFVHPSEQGKGYGKQLVLYALHEKSIDKVDVNEQNEKAFFFYKHLGFEVFSHEDTDAEGKPFPILHLQYKVLSENKLETERMLLRPFEETDLDDFFACCHNPHLGDNAGWKPHDTLEESEEMLHAIFLGQEDIWAMIDKKTNRVIGSIGLIPDPKRENSKARMLGYWLKESCWGQGLMTEAVQAVLRYGRETLGLELVSANCYPHNLRSQKVLQRNGFVYEGTLHRAEQVYTGEVFDHLCYYLLFE